MDFDRDKLLALPGITQEEFDRISKAILALVTVTEKDNSMNNPTKRYWTLHDADDMLTLLDPEKHYRVYVKHDGMVHMWLYENSGMAYDHDANVESGGHEIRDNFDYYWCIGDIDDLIARLHALRRQATQWFIAQGQPVPEPTWFDSIWQEPHKPAVINHEWSGWSAKETATPIPFQAMQGVRFFCSSSACHDHAVPLQADVATDKDAPYWTFVECPDCQSRYRVTWKNDDTPMVVVAKIDEESHDD